MENILETVDIDGIEEAMNESVDLDELETASATVIDFLIDGSSSMAGYAYSGVMEDCLRHYQSAILNSKQADEMVVSKSVFGSKLDLKGYVKPEKLDTSYSTSGCTRLYDAIIARVKMLTDYMKNQRKAKGVTPRGILVILSDGFDNISDYTLSDARNAILEGKKKEEITVAFITFGKEARGIAENLGIDAGNTIEVSNDESSLRHVIDIVSKSAISASKNASNGLNSDAGFFDV